ncbi:MAG: 50S ribosomal protein L9 [Phycisphaerae bacterium]
MKVLLRKNVAYLGKIGDLVEVKRGYARNYLLPRGLAYEPSTANVRQVEQERQRYLQELAHQRAEIEARAALVDGKEITISARANVEGHLYGSVGPAQIAAALADEGLFIESENVALPEPIRRLDKYEVPLRFGEDITATIHVWVVPIHGEGETGPQADDAPAEAPAEIGPGEGDGDVEADERDDRP